MNFTFGAARIAATAGIAALLFSSVGALRSAFAQAQTTQFAKPVPPGGTPLLPADPFTVLTVTPPRNANVSAQKVSVAGQPFTQALRIQSKGRFAMPYSAQLSGFPTGPVKRGDVLLATFYVRTVEGGKETGEALTEFVFERAGEPFDKAVTLGVNIPARGWKRIDLPFTAIDNWAANGAKVSFRLGFADQTFEIGGISLRNYGTGRVTMNDLPRTRATYAGIEADAAWRKAAQARIEKIRKGNLTVRVVDADGKPVNGATVAVRMKKHAFPFGSAVSAQMLLGTGPDAKKYQEMVPRLFNRVVMENDLKWTQYEENQARSKAGVSWLRARGIEVRGHNLIWPSAQYLPRDATALVRNGDKTALARRIDTHIANETQAFRGQLVEWDVVNEPFNNHDVMDVLGRDSLVHWYKLAHQNDPNAVLFLNDYPPLDGSATDNAHLSSLYQNVDYLIKNGAPLGGIGFQGHFGGSVIPPVRVLSGLNRFAVFNKPIAITEFDIDTTDEQFQAAYTRDFTTALFSHPSVNSIIMWGFWEGAHWRPNAAMYRRDWSIKPNGQAWLNLTQKTWWTNASGKTTRSGNYAARGFLGDYSITVTANNKTRTVPAKLVRVGSTVTVKMN